MVPLSGESPPSAIPLGSQITFVSDPLVLTVPSGVVYPGIRRVTFSGNSAEGLTKQ